MCLFCFCNLIALAMKTIRNTVLTVMGALACAPLAMAQITISQNVVFALTETSSVAHVTPTDSSGNPIRGAEPVFSNTFSTTNAQGQTVVTRVEGSKMVTTRISNREILLNLLDKRVISTIVGYSIQLRGTPDANGHVVGQFFAVKAGERPINLSEYLYVSTEEVEEGEEIEPVAEAQTFSLRQVQIPDLNRRTLTGRASGKQLISLDYDHSDVEIDMDGILNWSETLRTLGTEPNQTHVWVPGAASVTSISGQGIDVSTNAVRRDPTVIEGRITMSAGVVQTPTP